MNNQQIDLTSIDLINEDIHETIHVSSMRQSESNRGIQIFQSIITKFSI